MKTYWLYRGKAPLTAVRLPDGATKEQVICKALDELWHVPGVVCPSGISPGEMGIYILKSRVVVHDPVDVPQ